MELADIKERYVQRTDLTKINTYEELKDSIKKEMHSFQLSFVRIGYLLRVAADSNLLYESGYRNMEEFARAEFNLQKDSVSRFININKRFSEGGYSDHLREDFEKYGVAKLQEMLTLPDTIIDVITPEHTKDQIREIKRELVAEQDITEIELMSEEKSLEPDVLDTLCKRFLYYYFKTEEGAEIYVRLYRNMDFGSNELPGIRKVFEIMAPSGIATLFARVPQVGKLMMTITGMDKQVSILNMRNDEKELLDWENVIRNMHLFMPRGYEPEDCWEMIYAEDFPRPKKEERLVGTNKMPEKPVTDTSEGHSEPEKKEPGKRIKNAHELDKVEEYLEYIRKCAKERRWQQAIFTVRDLNDELFKLRDKDKVIDIPGQMSMEEMEGGAEDETKDEE